MADELYYSRHTGPRIDDGIDVAFIRGNKNLIVNPWLTVNQRKAFGSISNAFGFDMWTGNYNAVQETNRINFTAAAQFAEQPIDPMLYSYLVGKRLTASVKYGDGTIESGTMVLEDSAQLRYFFTGRVHCVITEQNRFMVWASRDSITVAAVKMEIGNVSTLANEFEPDYAEELLRCKRYFERFEGSTSNKMLGIGAAVNSALMFFTLPVVPKADAGDGTVRLAGSNFVYGENSMGGGTASGKSLQHTNYGNKQIIQMQINGSYTSGTKYIVGLPSNGYLDVYVDGLGG